MKWAMIGLGRMGSNMVRRAHAHGHECVAFDANPKATAAMAEVGATPVGSLAELVAALPRPRVVWFMLPAALVDQELDQLLPLLDPGDTVIDGGNSFYRDDVRRAARLAAAGVAYLDVGVSGGVFGLERGYCLMIGGEAGPVQKLAPLWAALAPGAAESARRQDQGRPPAATATAVAPAATGTTNDGARGTASAGWLYCGGPGAGHFVKMVHNGIEYGMMAAFAEGLNLLQSAGAGARPPVADAETAPLRDPEFYQYEFDVAAIAEVWRHGSVISSWLLDLTAQALRGDSALEQYAGRVSDSGEGRWTVAAALDTGVPVPVLSAALYDRFTSQGNAQYAHRVLSAMRHAFGGHLEKPRES